MTLKCNLAWHPLAKWNKWDSKGQMSDGIIHMTYIKIVKKGIDV